MTTSADVAVSAALPREPKPEPKAELKPHMCPGYAAARLEELAYWMGVLRKFEEANEAMKLKDWSPVGQ